ncbi:hypothetical protein AUEXF2481DRAFT_571469 [Aureobasidium subglaciale EXF-2481]|uniref:Uncharacterized protein n=1 Tax=Aureobasidium subglaciale (strain EXF-2481) TaxID=1043005 RepID=A0A074YU68_AURSE|nr:uncharacterized protein AUEXF2481DRAFT_571469 [Aureobasidium subglaciale EXF-2481]KEQ90396.1 hypothetical protein AUEXF2481DRAFT_571469 [Aureobasidium subglaciale EXF-2481]
MEELRPVACSKHAGGMLVECNWIRYLQYTLLLKLEKRTLGDLHEVPSTRHKTTTHTVTSLRFSFFALLRPSRSSDLTIRDEEARGSVDGSSYLLHRHSKRTSRCKADLMRQHWLTGQIMLSNASTTFSQPALLLMCDKCRLFVWSRKTLDSFFPG